MKIKKFVKNWIIGWGIVFVLNLLGLASNFYFNRIVYYPSTGGMIFVASLGFLLMGAASMHEIKRKEKS